LNLHFSESRNHTHLSKIIFKICSSVLGWPPNLISFLAFQIPYTLRTNLQVTPNTDLVFQWLHPSSIKSSQTLGGFRALHLCKQVFQIREVIQGCNRISQNLHRTLLHPWLFETLLILRFGAVRQLKKVASNSPKLVKRCLIFCEELFTFHNLKYLLCSLVKSVKALGI